MPCIVSSCDNDADKGIHKDLSVLLVSTAWRQAITWISDGVLSRWP